MDTTYIKPLLEYRESRLSWHKTRLRWAADWNGSPAVFSGGVIHIYVNKHNDSDEYFPMFAGDFNIKKSDFDNPCSIQFLNKSFLTLNNYEKY